MPDLAFMTDVKYIEVCCEADRLIGKEMKDHQEDGWEVFLKRFPVSCTGMTVNLKKANWQALGETSVRLNLLLPVRLGNKSPCPPGLMSGQ